MIIVEKYNETFLKISSENKSELSEVFSFFKILKNGHLFDPKFKMGIWDGTIELYEKLNSGNYLLYEGLLNELREICRKLNILLEETFISIKKDEELIEKINLKVDNFLKNNKFMAKDAVLENLNDPLKNPRYFQVKALKETAYYKKIILESSPGTGKTFIMNLITTYLLQEENLKKILIVVPSNLLIEQTYDEFLAYNKENTFFDMKNNLHKVNSKNGKFTDKKITLSTYQSLNRIKDLEYFEQFDAILQDEAHELNNNSLRKINESCINAFYRIALSGSLQETKKNKILDFMLRGLFGDKKIVLKKTHEAVKEGYLEDFVVKIYNLGYEKQDIDKYQNTARFLYNKYGKMESGKKIYDFEMTYLINHSLRGFFLTKMADKLSDKGNTLLLFTLVEKDLNLFKEKLEEYFRENMILKEIFVVSCEEKKANKKEVNKIIGKVEKSKNCIILSTYQSFSTGISINNLNNLLLCSPKKSPRKIIQSIGRTLRKSPDGKKSIVIDICDNLYSEENKYSRKNYSKKHCLERIEIYQDEKYKFEEKHFHLNRLKPEEDYSSE